MDFAIGWFEFTSAIAAYSNNSSSDIPSGFNLVTLNTPLVSVPVLSNTTVSTLLKASK